MLIATKYSERYGQRWIVGIIAQLWLLPCLIALIYLPSDASRWVRYAIVVLILGFPYPHPIHVAWCQYPLSLPYSEMLADICSFMHTGSRNSNTVRTRTVSAALYNMSVQLSGIIAANIYRDDDAPDYRRGNRHLAILSGLTIIFYLIARGYYFWRNQQRKKGWDILTPEEKRDYQENTTDEGSKRRDFFLAS